MSSSRGAVFREGALYVQMEGRRKSKAIQVSTMLLLATCLAGLQILSSGRGLQALRCEASVELGGLVPVGLSTTSARMLPEGKNKNPPLKYPPGRKYVVPGIEPILGKHRPDADAVFGAAHGYELDDHFVFIGSLLRTGYQGDIVVGVQPWKDLSPGLQAYLSYHAENNHVVYEIKGCEDEDSGKKKKKSSCNFDGVYKDPVTGTPAKDQSGHSKSLRKFRYEYSWIWLQRYGPNSRIWLVDFRDSYFQTDPFAHPTIPTNMRHKLLFFEMFRRIYGKQNKTARWIKDLYSPSMVDRVGDVQVICSGTTMGGKTAIEQYLLLMLWELDNVAGYPKWGGDQAHHNVLYFTGQLSNQTGIDDVVVFPNFEGAVATTGSQDKIEKWFDENSKVMFTSNRTSMSAIVHQYDRHNFLVEARNEMLLKMKTDAEVYLKQRLPRQESTPPSDPGGRGGSCDGTRTLWRVLVTANDAYEEDLLSWHHQCMKSGFCTGMSHREEGKRACDTTEIVLYAEDEALFSKYNSTSRGLEIHESWKAATKFGDKDRTTGGRSDYASGGSFKYMMSRRPSILLEELNRAKTLEALSSDNLRVVVTFSDLDVYFLKDPRPMIHSEIWDVDFLGTDAQNRKTGPYNGGLMFVRPTQATIDVISKWKHAMEARDEPGLNQQVLNDVIRASSATFVHKILSKNQFPVGRKFLKKSKDQVSLGSDVVAFHNNWCDRGCFKPERAKHLGLWRPDGYEIT